MPGKHAPGSPASFYLSLARAAAGALAAVGLVVAIVVVAVSSRGGDDPNLASSPPPKASQTPKGSASASPTPTASATESPENEPLVARKTLTVEIYNATDTAGLAGRTEERVNERGYRRTSVDNAPNTDKTTIFFRGSLRREAERMLADFPEFKRVRQARSSTPGSAQITIILGSNYDGPS